MATPVVETHTLGKTFGETPVLRGVNLTMLPGSVVLLIGGNGAGKSTLLRILAGISRPTSGKALIFGEDSRQLSALHRKRIGMLSHQSWLYSNLTARENLEFFADLYGIAYSGATADGWLGQVGLLPFAGERVRTFSRGMEQRLSLARTMIIDPLLMLLDEPFAALDADGVATVNELIRNQVHRGAAVMMTAHRPMELDGLELEMHSITRGRLTVLQDEPRGGRLRSFFGR